MDPDRVQEDMWLARLDGVEHARGAKSADGGARSAQDDAPRLVEEGRERRRPAIGGVGDGDAAPTGIVARAQRRTVRARAGERATIERLTIRHRARSRRGPMARQAG